MTKEKNTSLSQEHPPANRNGAERVFAWISFISGLVCLIIAVLVLLPPFSKQSHQSWEYTYHWKYVLGLVFSMANSYIIGAPGMVFAIISLSSKFKPRALAVLSLVFISFLFLTVIITSFLCYIL